MTIEEFQKLLKKNNINVSEIEYTSNNFDSNGKLIKQDLPTITTDFCEIGLNNKEIYFVFVIKSKTFTKKLFESIKNKKNITIYPFKNFKRTLFPFSSFNYDLFMSKIYEEQYLQLQFNFKKITSSKLYEEYLELVAMLNKNNIEVVDQLKVNLKSFK